MAEQGTDDMAMRDDASGVTDRQAGLESEYLRERRQMNFQTRRSVQRSVALEMS